jgi:hypothetical protein
MHGQRTERLRAREALKSPLGCWTAYLSWKRATRDSSDHVRRTLDHNAGIICGYVPTDECLKVVYICVITFFTRTRAFNVCWPASDSKSQSVLWGVGELRSNVMLNHLEDRPAHTEASRPLLGSVQAPRER